MSPQRKPRLPTASGEAGPERAGRRAPARALATTPLSSHEKQKGRITAAFKFAICEELLQARRDRRAEIARRLHCEHASLFERRELACRRALAAGSDRACMAHALAGWRRGAGDEADHGLG